MQGGVTQDERLENLGQKGSMRLKNKGRHKGDWKMGQNGGGEM